MKIVENGACVAQGEVKIAEEEGDHRTDRLRSPSSYGDRILGSNRKYFAALGGPDSLSHTEPYHPTSKEKGKYM